MARHFLILWRWGNRSRFAKRIAPCIRNPLSDCFARDPGSPCSITCTWLRHSIPHASRADGLLHLHRRKRPAPLSAGSFIVTVEVWGIEPQSESGIESASTTRSSDYDLTADARNRNETIPQRSRSLSVLSGRSDTDLTGDSAYPCAVRAGEGKTSRRRGEA